MNDDIDDTEKEYYKTLTLDVEYYQSFLDDKDIPEDKKCELIATLWHIVVSFVDLGLGIHPLQQANADNETQLHPSVLKMITEVANEDTKTTPLKEAWPERSKV